MIDAALVTVQTLCGEYAAAADPERAEAMSRYMKGRFTFFGIPAPERRAIDRRVLARVGRPSDERALVALVRRSWDRPEREVQYFACDLLRRYASGASPALLGVCRELILATPWWDTVDALATRVVGPLVLAHPRLVAEMDRWAGGEDLWLARAAIIHQLTFGERTDSERLFRYALAWADEQDFFIRKGIGWALRQYARTDPAAVIEFVRGHRDRLSGLTRREALKHLGDPGA